MSSSSSSSIDNSKQKEEEQTPSFMSMLGTIGLAAMATVAAIASTSSDDDDYDDDDDNPADKFLFDAISSAMNWAKSDPSSSSSSSSSAAPAPAPVSIKPKTLIGVRNREEVLNPATQLFWPNLTVSQLVVTGPHRVTMIGGLLSVPRIHLNCAVYDPNEAEGTLTVEFLPAVWPPRQIPKFPSDSHDNFRFQLVGFVNIVRLSDSAVGIFDAPRQTLIPQHISKTIGDELSKEQALRHGCFWRTKFLLDNEAACRLHDCYRMEVNKMLVSCTNGSKFWLLDGLDHRNIALLIVEIGERSAVYIELNDAFREYPKLVGNCTAGGNLQLWMRMTRSQASRKFKDGLLNYIGAEIESIVDYTATDLAEPRRLYHLNASQKPVPALYMDFTKSYNAALEAATLEEQARALAAFESINRNYNAAMDRSFGTLITPTTRKKARTEGVRKHRARRRKKAPSNPLPPSPPARGEAPAPFSLPCSSEADKAAAPFVPALNNPDQPFRKGKNIQCVICQENRAFMAPEPCGHLKYCYQCAQRTEKKWNEDRASGMSEETCKPKCCMCRMPVSRFITMYYDEFDVGDEYDEDDGDGDADAV